MKYLFYITLLLFVCSGCKKPEELRETYYIDKELYDYALFPKGSWWIYKEETSELEDSVVITKKEQYINKVRIAADYDFEVYDVDIYSSQNGTGWGGASAYLEGTHGYSMVYERFSASPSISSVAKYAGKINLKKKAALDGKWSYLKKSDTLGFYTVGSTTFSDVIVFEKIKYIDYDMVDYDVMKRYFFAKNIGLIREEDLVNSKTWNLIKHNINN